MCVAREEALGFFKGVDVSNVSLYKLSEELINAMRFLTDDLGEIDENMELKVKELQEMIVTKTDAVCEWRNSQLDLIDAAQRRIDELKDFQSRIESGLTKLDKYVGGCMEMLDQDKFEGVFSSITKIKPRDVVEVYDADKIPPDFLKIPEPVPSIDKTALLKVLKSGHDVSGARLGKSKLSIKYKLK